MAQTSATTQEDLSRRTSKIPSKRQSAQPKQPQSTIPRPSSVHSATTMQVPPAARGMTKFARSSYIAASTSNLPISHQPAKVHAKKPSHIVMPKGPTTRVSHGLLTPGSVHSRASSVSETTSTPGIPTPSAPKKQGLKVNARDDGSSNVKTLFMEAHIGEHCIKGALVHKLACGHKVITAKVEDCASNCVRPLLKHLEEHANQATEEAFVCSACIEQHVQSHCEAKRALFEQTFRSTEQKMIAFPRGWLGEQREYWEKVWKNDIVMEKKAFAMLGRKCTHFGDQVMSTSVKKEKSATTAVAFPPSRRPRPSRALDRTIPDPLSKDGEIVDAEAKGKRDSKRDSILE